MATRFLLSFYIAIATQYLFYVVIERRTLQYGRLDNPRQCISYTLQLTRGGGVDNDLMAFMMGEGWLVWFS